MTKKIVEKLIVTVEFARRVKRTESAVTKAFRTGKFGETAQKGPRGELLFRWPQARDTWLARTDPTRKRLKNVLDDSAPTPAVPSAAPTTPAVDLSRVAVVDAEIAAEFSRVRRLVFAACAGLDGDAKALLVESLELADWVWSLPGAPLPGDMGPIPWLDEAIDAWGPRPWLDADEVAP